MSRPMVFLSYTKSDEALIRRIAFDLRECQIDAWYDKWEIKPGESLTQRILVEAIPAADAFFVYLTPESVESKWVKDELETAREEARTRGLPVLTFANSADTIQRLPSYLRTKSCPVISSEHYELGLRQLIRAVTEAAGERELEQLRQQVEYVLKPTLREIPLLDAIRNVGLVDIENRDDKRRTGIPPFEFYRLARKELFISGISAQRSFDQEIQTLRNTLASGKRLRVLIMNPDSDVVPWLAKRETKPIRDDIVGVIKTAAEYEGFVNHPSFSMRLMDSFPTFTAMMIDGDIEGFVNTSTTNDVRDSGIQVRIQPTTIYQSHHGGLVIQLKKSSEVLFPLVDFVAEELRQQWANAVDVNAIDLSKWFK